MARSPLQQPFSTDSIWNMPIGTGAIYVPSNLNGNPTDPNNSTNTTYAPMPESDQERIILSASSPLVNINYSSAGWTGTSRCAATGSLLFTAPVPATYVLPSDNGNDCAAILSADGRTIKQCQPLALCTAGGPGTALATFADVDLYGQGITGAHGGSGLSAIGGSLRVGELRATDTVGPKHALKINLYAKEFLYKAPQRAPANYSSGGTGGSYRWPATTSDSYWNNTSTGYGMGSNAVNNSNPDMCMGALLAIPASTAISSLGLETVPGKLLAWTLQNYGAYIVDDTGGPAVALSVEAGAQGSFLTQFQSDYGYAFDQRVNISGGTSAASAWVRDMQRLVTALQVVSNNSPTTVGGGGTALQPLADPISPNTKGGTNPVGPMIDPSSPPGIMPASDPNGSYTLTFSDEFNGTSLRANTYTDYFDWYQTPTMPSQNYDVNGGNLRIWPPSDVPTSTYQNHVYGNAPDRNLTTRHSFSQVGGYWEARIKMNVGRCQWPGFWLYDANTQNEFDIFEAYGPTNTSTGWDTTGSDGYIHPNNFAETIWNQTGSPVTSVKYADPTSANPPGAGVYQDYTQAFHVWGLKWDPVAGTINQFLDGVQWGPTIPWTKQNALFLLLQLAFGHTGGNDETDTDPPRGSGNPFLCDYVRVWQLGSTTSGGGGTTTNAANTTAPNIDTTTPNRVQPLGFAPNSYTINFSDEFNGTTLDTTKWNDKWTGDTSTHLEKNYDLGQGGNSMLRIWPPSANPTTSFPAATFGSDPDRVINGDGLTYLQYGYIEARIQSPVGPWMIPNFWMVNRDHDSLGEPQVNLARMRTSQVPNGYAVDPGNSNTYPVKTDGYIVDDSYALLSPDDQMTAANFAAKPYTFGMKWDPTGYYGYLNGQLVWSHATTADTDRKFPVLSLSYDNTNSAYPLTSTSPTRGSTNAMQVDYVRLWTPSSLTPINFPNSLLDSNTALQDMPFGDQTGLYALALSDEFSLDYLNPNNWKDHLWNTTSDIRLNYDTNRNFNSCLCLWPDDGFIARYISGEGVYSLSTGYWEWKATLPIGQGPAPVFKLLNHAGSTIPAIEVWGYPGGSANGYANSSLHPTGVLVNVWNDLAVSNKAGSFQYQSGLDLSAAFHYYGIRIDTATIQFFFDGVMVWSIPNTLPPGVALFPIFGLDFGGPSGSPGAATPISTPNSFSVDYLRGWTLLGQASSPVPAAGAGYNTTFNIFRGVRYR